MMACPAHTNAGRYVGLIAEGRFEEAYRFAREPNPLASFVDASARIPARPRAAAAKSTSPFPSAALKRFLTEQYGPESKRPDSTSTPAASK